FLVRTRDTFIFPELDDFGLSGTSYGYIHINLQGNKIAPGTIISKVVGFDKVKTGHIRTNYIYFYCKEKPVNRLFPSVSGF
ncbi:MAG: hypothetical protein Q7J85_09970, partial [Bacillota bacterium]|nr:hypothetical protein [Bacillota bacterium]